MNVDTESSASARLDGFLCSGSAFPRVAMGCGASKDGMEKSQDVEAQMNADREEDQQIHKLLLLGAGESGKSTLFKQMINIYGTGWSEKEKKGYIAIIFRNIVAAAEELSKQATDPTNTTRWGEAYVLKDEESNKACQVIKEVKYDDGGTTNAKIPPQLLDAVKQLWNDPVVKLVFSKASEYQLNDTSGYFLDKVDSVCAADYLPSDDDVLRARVRGQRNERKKWIHCFDNVTAVLFVASISSYNQKLYEDESVDRIDEEFNLFENICNSRWFKSTSIILFLNKSDLFREKIEKVPLVSVFGSVYTEWAESQNPRYPDAYSEGTSFLEAQFLSRNHYKKQIYTHVTCATNKDNVEVVFNGVKDIVVRGALETAGLV
eukprot:g39978.t1